MFPRTGGHLGETSFPSSLLLLALTLGAAGAFAHPFHITSGEAQHDHERQILEVAIELNPVELQRAIELRLGQRIDLDAPSAETIIARYTADVFSVVSNNERASFNWVGMELKISTGWLYFELGGVDALQGAQVSNRFLVEVAELGENEQLNTVRFRSKSGALSDRWRSVTFSAPDYREELLFNVSSQTDR